jgi:hypothetical protein
VRDAAGDVECTTSVLVLPTWRVSNWVVVKDIEDVSARNQPDHSARPLTVTQAASTAGPSMSSPASQQAMRSS